MLEGGRASPGEQAGRGARARGPAPASTVPRGVRGISSLEASGNWSEAIRSTPSEWTCPHPCVHTCSDGEYGILRKGG